MTRWQFKSEGQPITVWQPDGPGRRELIIISHGAGGSMLDHRGTARKLGKDGWTVCAPLHVGDNFRDKSKLGTDAYWVDRPQDISNTLDAVLNHPKLSGQLNPECIGAIGFSAGGYSVLAAAGGQPDLKKLEQHCADPSGDPRFCAFGGAPMPSPRRARVNPSLPRDERIKAIALVAPVGAVFGEGALDTVTSDILLIRAGQDQILASPHHAENIHQLLGRAHIYETIADLHHFGFIQPFPWYLGPFGFEAAKDPKSYKRRTNLDLLNSKVSKFMADCLS